MLLGAAACTFLTASVGGHVAGTAGAVAGAAVGGAIVGRVMYQYQRGQQ